MQREFQFLIRLQARTLIEMINMAEVIVAMLNWRRSGEGAQEEVLFQQETLLNRKRSRPVHKQSSGLIPLEFIVRRQSKLNWQPQVKFDRSRPRQCLAV